MVESNGGASIANVTSLPDVDRMSFVSYQSLNATVTQYIGSAARSGLLPYCASSSAARSSASGCLRNASHSGGAPGGSGPAEGWASKSPLHVTERSPRMFSVSSAFTWPAFGMPTRMPDCCRTLGSETVASIRPNSSGRSGVLVEIREERRRRHGLRRKRERRTGANGTGRSPGSARRPQSRGWCRRRCTPSPD